MPAVNWIQSWMGICLVSWLLSRFDYLQRYKSAILDCAFIDLPDLYVFTAQEILCVDYPDPFINISVKKIITVP